MNRRNFLRRTSMIGAGLGAGMLAGQTANAQQQNKPAQQEQQQQDHSQHGQTKPAASAPNNQSPGQAADGSGFLPVHAPDLPKLPYKLEDGVKVFQLVAEQVRVEFLPKSSWSDAHLLGHELKYFDPVFQLIRQLRQIGRMNGKKARSISGLARGLIVRSRSGGLRLPVLRMILLLLFLLSGFVLLLSIGRLAGQHTRSQPRSNHGCSTKKITTVHKFNPLSLV